MKRVDEWTSKAGYEIYDLPTEVVILDQHVQCLHYACKLQLSLKISFVFVWIYITFNQPHLHRKLSKFQGFLQYGVPSSPEKLLTLMNKVT